MTSTSVFGKPAKGPNAPVPEESVEEEDIEPRASAHFIEPVTAKSISKGRGTSQKQSG